ncbi:hypothetical protein IV203_037811 [Nitzschia inconspicua]|uniref:F-box domain-containing protein n=1 Tax=Nitzschia inconspicua TaxID=303405 RepID=A0A9K3LLE9_9STRA|nr:hypothetical protein IV203_037811 [Nitzschia inconspicua]
MPFSDLPDTLVKNVASFLPPRDLCRFEMVDRWTHQLDTDELWKTICENRWKQLPRYRLTPARLEWIRENLPSMNWKRRFVWVEDDATRTRITWEEMEAHTWYFNFTPEAGGRGSDTLQTCRFSQGFLFLSQYLPMPYRLEVLDGVQYLRIYHFPPHRVDRLPNAEWLITNINVTFVSCGENEALAFRERGFQGNHVERGQTT